MGQHDSLFKTTGCGWIHLICGAWSLPGEVHYGGARVGPLVVASMTPVVKNFTLCLHCF